MYPYLIVGMYHTMINDSICIYVWEALAIKLRTSYNKINGPLQEVQFKTFICDTIGSRSCLTAELHFPSAMKSLVAQRWQPRMVSLKNEMKFGLPPMILLESEKQGPKFSCNFSAFPSHSFSKMPPPVNSNNSPLPPPSMSHLKYPEITLIFGFTSWGWGPHIFSNFLPKSFMYNDLWLY